MRFGFAVLLLLSSLLATAQLPSFTSEPRRSPLPAGVAADIGAEFSDFEAVHFDHGALRSHLRATGGATSFELAVGSHRWVFELEPFEVRADDYVLRVQDEHGVHTVARPELTTYRGYTLGAKPAEVRLTVADAFVMGFVAEAGDAVFFQSQWLTSEASGPTELIVFRGSDGILPAEHGCGVGPEHGEGLPAGAQRGAAMPNQCFEVELAIASDFSMFQSYGSNATALEARNAGVMAFVNSDYAGQFADDYQFIVTEQFVSTCNTCDPWSATTSAGGLLDDFTGWAGNGFSSPHDLGQLWTDRNFNGSTIGVAWLQGLCSSARYHVLQDFSSNADLTRVLVSHEIGHNFSCSHDGGGSPFIMAPAVQITNTWSGNSIAQVDAFAPNRGCLSTYNCGGATTPPVADFDASPRAVCEGQQVQFADLSQGATSYQWSFDGGSPATSTDPNPTVTYNTSGTWDVTLVVTNPFGTDTKFEQAYINVSPLPSVAFSATTAGPLALDFLNLTANATSFSWSFGDGATSTAVNPSHTYSAPGTYNVILTAFNNCGSASFTQIIDVLVPPTAAFTSTNPEGCAPLSVSFTDQSTGVIAGYNWSFPGGTPSASTAANPTVVYSQPGTYDVTLVVGNASGNNTLLEADYVVVGEAPAAGFGVSLSGNTATVTSTATGATAFSYDFGDGTSSTQANPSNTYAAGGTYTITQTVTNACGSATATETVTIAAAPVASFAVSNTSPCLNELITLTSTSSGTPTSLQWTVTRPDGSTQAGSASPFQFVADQRGAYTVALTAANATGQNTSTQVAAFTVVPEPLALITANPNGQQVDFTGSVSPGVALSYAWAFGDGATATGANVTHTYAAAGTYAVTLTVTTACETATTQTNVTVGTAPTATITSNANGPVCTGDAVVYGVQVSGNATSITWTLPGATPATASGPSVTATYPAAGSYTVEVEVCNALGCNTQALAGGTIVEAAPTAGFTLTQSGLTINATSMASGAAAVTYDFGDGSTSASPDPTHTYAAPGTYTVRQVASGPCGSDVVTQSVTVGGAPAAAFGVNLPSGLLCVGATVEYVDQSTGGATGLLWSFPGGTPATSTAANPTVTYANPGTYDATLTVTNALGSNTVTQQNVVTVSSAPTAAFTSTTVGLTAEFASQSTGVATYDWDFGDGATSTDNNPEHTYAQSGTYTVTLTVANDCGSTTTTETVAVLAAPTASFTQSAQQVCAGEMVAFDASASAGATSYQWSFPGGSPATSQAVSPTVTYATDGAFDVRLVVVNAAGQDVELRAQAVSVLAQAVADFTADVSMLSVSVSNASTAATNFAWDFGDGTTSTSASPTHTYASAGTYTITLSATNSCGTSVATRTVTVAPGLPNAVIQLSQNSGCAPFATTYRADESIAAEDYAWSFPGGSPAQSSAATVTVTYDEPGDYAATLVVSNASGADTLTLADAVTVLGVPEIIPRVPIVNDLTVSLAATVIYANTVDWDFGDGTTLLDGDTLVQHTYPGVGEYDVVLTVTNDCGTTRDTVEVLVGAVPDAEFEADASAGCAPFAVTLTDRSTGSPSAWLWTVTSPSAVALTSTEQNPTFVLTEEGSYTVSLEATNAAGSATEVTTDFLEVLPPTQAEAELLSLDDETASFASALVGVDSLVWDFGDGATSMQEMPTHRYGATGTYTVTLTAFGPCGTSTSTLSVEVTVVSVSALPAGASLRLYPNPTRGLTQLELAGLPAERVSVVIYDELGRAVWRARLGQASAFRQNLATEDFAPGVYVVEVRGESFAARLPLVKAR